MTDLATADINKYHALREGWYRDKHGFWYHPKYRPKATTLRRLLDPNSGPLMGWKNEPDFCGDWNYAGPLYKRAMDDGFNVQVYKEGDMYICEIRKGAGAHRNFALTLAWGRGSDPETAIARAAHAMGEDEG